MRTKAHSHRDHDGTKRRFRLSFYIRQIAALLFAATLAVEYFRNSEMISVFSFWCLATHFIYFQLPHKSRALAWFHPLSYIAAIVTPVQYGMLLFLKPRLEYDRMELWEIQLTTILVRSFLLYLAPMVFHALDLGCNQNSLAKSYSMKPQKLMFVWSAFAYPFFGLIFDFTFPSDEQPTDAMALEYVGSEYVSLMKYTSLGMTLFAWVLLYLQVLRVAYMHPFERPV